VREIHIAAKPIAARPAARIIGTATGDGMVFDLLNVEWSAADSRTGWLDGFTELKASPYLLWIKKAALLDQGLSSGPAGLTTTVLDWSFPVAASDQPLTLETPLAKL